MPNTSIHVVPHAESWAVKRSNASAPFSTHETKAAAIAAARKIAKREEIELVIHNEYGQIENPNSFGGDPQEIQDAKH